MTSVRLSNCRDALGQTPVRLAVAATALGAVALLAGFALGEGGLVLAALAAAWLFFTGLAVGGVALSAIFTVAKGKWGASLLPSAEAASGFFAPSLALLALIVLGARLWMPWAAAGGVSEWAPVAARDLAGAGVLFWVGRRFLGQSRSGEAATRRAIVYLLTYVVVLTMWTLDLVMSLHDWTSTVVPAYYFMCSLLAGLAWATLTATLRTSSGFDSNARHDAGKLLFGFATFCAYLLWSAFLPTWYANIPEETGHLISRWQGGYRPAAFVVLIAAYLYPFVSLVLERAKRSRLFLSVAALSVLVGLAADRFLLVFPSLGYSGGVQVALLGAGVAAGVFGLFALSFGAALGAPVARKFEGPAS